MPKLSLFLLGSPRVKLDEADIEVKPRKAFALLIFLAVTAETHTRDFLATLLWPASDQRRARRALRNRLSELKQTLGGSWIEAGRETIGLRSGCWLDTAEFQRLSAAEHADPERLLEAVDLYRDDFLAGFTLPDCPAYDEWQYFQSESLRGDLAAALDRLVETLSDRGDYETAVPHARRRLALDPLHEPACRQLMRLYARAGQQSAALRQYDLCRQALAEELGVEPQEETMDLYDQIQTGSFVRQVRPRHNLPVQTTTFIGREVELAAIERLLLDEEEYRLLTLVGPGGTGKTRLALAAAAEAHDHFPDGVYFVSLATANDAAQVPKVIAETFGIIEKPHEPLAETLQDYFRHQQMLLILDNFEHVLDAASLVNALLQAAPHLTILTSSREALRLSGEQEYQVPPLALPEPGQIEALPDLLEVESIALFVNRTRASSSNFELTAENAGAVAGICRRLDGLPLAIELAAARIKLFTPRQLLQRLQNRLGLLVAGPRDLPDRQRTLRDTIDWSYHLLEEMEKQLFARLAVFSGGCTVEAVEVICDFEPVGDPLSALGSLLDKSLLYQRVGPAGEPRFYMLETIGEYARERLKQREEEEPLRRRHAEYYVALAETAEPQLRLADQALWMDRLESEHDNLRGALSWLLVQDPISGLRLGAAIGHFWHVRAHHSEGRVWLAKFLEITDSDRCSIVVRAKALNTLSMLTWFQGEYHAALALQEEGLTLWQEAGEQGDGLAMGNRNLAMAQWFTGDLPAAQVTIAESVKLFKKTGNEAWADDALFFQGFFARTIGDLDFAQTKAYENLRLARKVGDIMGLAGGYSLLGHIAYDQSNFDSARVNYEKSLAYFCEVGDLFGMSFLLSSLSDVYHVKGDYDSEENNWQEYLEIARKIGNKLQIAYALSRLGLVSMLLNENEQARKCFAQCLDICSELEERRHEATAECLSGMVLWLLNKEKPAQAAQLLGFVQQFLTGEGDLEDIFLSVHDRVLAEVKRQLEEEIFISSTAAGRALTVDQAIDYAAAIIQASALFLVD